MLGLFRNIRRKTEQNCKSFHSDSATQNDILMHYTEFFNIRTSVQSRVQHAFLRCVHNRHHGRHNVLVFLAGNYKATYVYYISVRKMTIKEKVMLSLLLNCERNALAAKIIFNEHLDDRILYWLTEGNILLKIEGPGAFVRNDHVPVHLQANDIHSYGNALLGIFHARHLEQIEKRFVTFPLFLENNIQQVKVKSDSTTSFSSELCHHLSTMQTKGQKREYRL